QSSRRPDQRAGQFAAQDAIGHALLTHIEPEWSWLRGRGLWRRQGGPTTADIFQTAADIRTPIGTAWGTKQRCRPARRGRHAAVERDDDAVGDVRHRTIAFGPMQAAVGL